MMNCDGKIIRGRKRRIGDVCREGTVRHGAGIDAIENSEESFSHCAGDTRGRVNRKELLSDGCECMDYKNGE